MPLPTPGLPIDVQHFLNALLLVADLESGLQEVERVEATRPARRSNWSSSGPAWSGRISAGQLWRAPVPSRADRLLSPPPAGRNAAYDAALMARRGWAAMVRSFEQVYPHQVRLAFPHC